MGVWVVALTQGKRTTRFRFRTEREAARFLAAAREGDMRDRNG